MYLNVAPEEVAFDAGLQPFVDFACLHVGVGGRALDVAFGVVADATFCALGADADPPGSARTQHFVVQSEYLFVQKGIF